MFRCPLREDWTKIDLFEVFVEIFLENLTREVHENGKMKENWVKKLKFCFTFPRFQQYWLEKLNFDSFVRVWKTITAIYRAKTDKLTGISRIPLNHEENYRNVHKISQRKIKKPYNSTYNRINLNWNSNICYSFKEKREWFANFSGCVRVSIQIPAVFLFFLFQEVWHKCAQRNKKKLSKTTLNFLVSTRL